MKDEQKGFRRGTCRIDRDVPVVFEKSCSGHRGYELPSLDAPIDDVVRAGDDAHAGDPGELLQRLIPKNLRRKRAPCLPEVTEPEVVRHYVELSMLNHHVDRGFYPLGSCTMKYSPKVNDALASLPGFAGLHPYVPLEACQGVLELLWELGKALATITGMDAVSLQPSAGAQGETLGMRLTRAYHQARGNRKRVVLIPDSAHGTNPASVRQAGYDPVVVRSRRDGRVDLDAFQRCVNDETAALMITNPNTLGLFEDELTTIAAQLHEVDALVYMDGANLNALLGLVRAGDTGADMVHINLHKTFSTPHGGGGPGAGPLAVKRRLEPFLPVPLLARRNGCFVLEGVEERPRTIGYLHPFLGNVGILVRAYAYIRKLGAEGLRAVSRAAILNANYLKSKLEDLFPAYPGPCMHEFVASTTPLKGHGVRNTDVAKRLLDYGMHAPTVSFPLTVPDCLMIEPTETETRRTLDAFAAALHEIAEEAATAPEMVKTAPHATPLARLDEVTAARQLRLRWRGPA